MGLDVSSNSYAFAIFEAGQLIQWGEIDLSGVDHTARLIRLRKYLLALRGTWGKFDCVVLEKPIFVNSNKTASLLSQTAGVVKSIMAEDTLFVEVVPTEWYKAIGNNQWTKLQKEQFKMDYPDKTDSWYKGQFRQARKQFTIDWVKSTFGVVIDNDNVADAIGIGWSQV